MKQMNTKQVRSFIFKNRLFFWIGCGAVVAALISAMGIGLGLSYYVISLYVGYGVLAFIVFVIVGLIAGKRASGKFRRQVVADERNAAIPFDQDNLQSLSKEKNVYLGKEWILLRHDNKIRALPKNMIRSVDSHIVRKEGMEQLWIHVLTTAGESQYAMYKACTPDVLATVANWLNPAPAPEAAPAETPSAAASEPIKLEVPEQTANPEKPIELVMPDPIETAPEPVKAAPGTCPYCTGPNDPEQTVCQWCGKQIK